EVQDGLSTGDALRQAAGALQAGVQSADQAEALTRLRYQAGAGNRLELAQSQLNRLAYQRQVLQNQGQQLLNAVQLVKALGGGWHTAPTSTPQEMTP
ncbi:hypothetical protein KXX11_004382, partial [Aspergillus fumigatus]